MTKRKEYFSNRSSMFHYAASADYDGGYIKSANSYIDGGEVYSYATKVALIDREREILLYTGHYYSQTTSNTMSELRRAFDHYKKLMTFDFRVDEAWERVQKAVKLHDKHPATRKPEKEFFIETVDSLKNVVEFFRKGQKYLKSKTMERAEEIVTKYKKEIEEKRKRQEEIWAKRREREEQERQERIDRTEAIVREYMPDYDGEPKTFRECMEKDEVHIPRGWLKEHHPELFYEDGRLIEGRVLLDLRYNYNTHNYDDYLIYRQDRYSYKLMRQISRWGGNYSSAPDILVYNKDKKLLYTSQHCEVDDIAGHVKTLLGLFLKAIDEEKDVSFVIGKHCGPYEIREWNSTEKFLRVGCHCFLLENLREVYEDMKGV